MNDAVNEPGSVRRAADSSAAVRVGSRVVAWCRQTNGRLAVGLRRRSSRPSASPDQLRMVAEDSMTVRALSRLVDYPVMAWHNSAARHFVESVLALDLVVRLSLLGWMLLAAVATHIAILALLRVPVFWLGWSTRAVLGLLAVALIARPAAFAAAWRERRAR